MIRLACSTAKDIQQMRGLSTHEIAGLCTRNAPSEQSKSWGRYPAYFGEIHADHWLIENAFYEEKQL
jgi:hypothetical protein